MTEKEQIERISKLLNELSLDDITSAEFNEMFPKQSINELKDEMWRMCCFVSDVCYTINMGDTAEQEPCEDCISRQAVIDKICSIDGMEGLENSNLFEAYFVKMIKALPSVNPAPKMESEGEG